MMKFGQEMQEIERGGFDDLVNEQYILPLDDGYEVSVIRGPLSYGGDEGLFEMAIRDPEYRCPAYDVDIDIFGGDLLLGYLTEEQVAEHLATLKARHTKK